MLKVTVRKVGGIVVIRCVGRIVADEDFCAVRDGIGHSGENLFGVKRSFSSATIKIPHGVEGFPVRAGSERSPVLPVGQHA